MLDELLEVGRGNRIKVFGSVCRGSPNTPTAGAKLVPGLLWAANRVLSQQGCAGRDGVASISLLSCFLTNDANPCLHLTRR